MVICEMMETDLSKVCVIEEETFSEPWSREDFLSSMKEPNNEYLIAKMEDTLVGYCGYWGIAGEGYIYNVAVRKEYRQQNIGYQLLNALIERACMKGIASLTLEVRISNIGAIRLYEKLGFVHAGVRKDFYTKPKEDAIIMWWKRIQQFPL